MIYKLNIFNPQNSFVWHCPFSFWNDESGNMTFNWFQTRYHEMEYIWSVSSQNGLFQFAIEAAKM